MTALLDATTTPIAEPADRRGPLRPGRLIPARARLNGRVLARFFQAVDLAALGAWTFAGTAAGGAVGPLAAAALACALVLGLARAYDFARGEGLARHLARAAGAALAGLAMLFALGGPAQPPAALGGALSVVAVHALWWAVVRRWRREGRLTPNVLVVGATGAAERLIAALLETREANVLGVFDDRLARRPSRLLGVPVLGSTADLVEHRLAPYADRIVVTLPPKATARVHELVARLRGMPNEITLLLDGQGEDGEAAAIARIADAPLARLGGSPSDPASDFAKRAQDLVVGSLALILALPIMAVVALAIRLDSPGPVLFRQRRHGFNNEEIVVYKFRSMLVEAADAHATRQVTAEDDRVTRVGRFIRRTSLDELPQILNVLKGEMSLVGPRPHAIGMMTGDVESARLVAEYAHRHRVKPGMTGWAAIHGSRGPVDTPEAVRRRVELDVEYIARRSTWLDLWIMAMTLPCLLGDSDAVR